MKNEFREKTLTFGVIAPTKYGVIIPVIAPIPFVIAINVPALFGDKSRAFTFIPE